jgi:hypothetical protein
MIIDFSVPRRLNQRRRYVREENLQGDGTAGEERIQRLGGLEQLLPGRPLTVQGKTGQLHNGGFWNGAAENSACS